ncbi:MAG: hypothetical protein BWY40_00160 [bacterium ADurb.Bin270]|nr:MAG: hypothetical protein BWY40_00160 [bacterium ADurb.Bin270]
MDLQKEEVLKLEEEIFKMKRSLVYLGLAIIAVIIALSIENPFSSRVADSDGMGYFVKDYASKNVAELRITQLLDGVSLKKRDGVWIASEILTDAKKALLSDEQRSEPEISSSNADSEKIISYLGMFGGLEEGIEVSSNPDNHNTYMVGAAGLRVTALSSDGKKIFDVIIGSGGPDFGSTYIRRFDEERVYLVRRPLLGVFSPRAQDWLAPESKEEDQIPLSDSNSPNR